MSTAARIDSSAGPPPFDVAVPLAAQETRILILAPTGNDARLTADFLTKAGLSPQLCRDISELTTEIRQGCGAILLAEEALAIASASGLAQELSRQPPWSDVPLVIITGGRETSQSRLRRLAMFESGGNVALLERPFRPAMLISAVEVALRARRRQYQARDLLQTITGLSTKIKEQARIFNVTLSHIRDFAYILDRAGRFLYANQALLDLWGLTLDQAVGKDFFDLHYPGELAARLHRQVQQVIHTKEWIKDETAYTSPAGVEGYYEYIFNPVFAPDGSVEMVAGSTHIITERKRAEAVAESQRRVLQLMAEDAPLSEVLASLVRTVELAYASKGLGSICLLDPDGVHLRPGAAPSLPETFSKAFDGLAIGPAAASCGTAAFTKNPVYVADIATDPLWAQFKDLALAHCLRACWSFPILSSQGGVLGTFALYHLEHRRADDADLRIVEVATRTASIAIERKASDAAARRLAAIVESSDDAIISKDLNSIIKTWNAGAERLFGYQAAEAIGKPVTLVMPSERRNEEPVILERIRRGERVEHYETVRERKDGSRIEVSLTVSPIRDAQGKVVGASQIARDITERKRAERELERAHRDMMAASRAKDDFLAALSHELRTPLNPVLLLASESAEDPALPEHVRAQFRTIRHNVELEARLIDDLLDITRIAHGKLSLNMAVVDVHELLKEALATVRSELDHKGISLTLELEAEHSAVEGDAVRLQQVLWNVLKNAVKFTAIGGRIDIGTRANAGTGELVISITDNGIGLTDRDISRIFEGFTQGEHAAVFGSHRFGGLGLGLTISRKLLELHGGSIQASSAGRNQGSTFTIKLPLAPRLADEATPLHVGASSRRTAKCRRAAALKILLVEDHEPTRITLASLLTRRGYQVKSAASVAEARALAAEQQFHLLISDIGLPDGNGFDLMKELRIRDNSLQGIALTGYGMEQDIAASRNAGFGGHLTKPVRVQSLEEALISVQTASSPTEAGSRR